MKKDTKGKPVLSTCQLQAVRLNRLEYRRLQNHINSLHDDLQNHLARLHREKQSLKYHFTNVVRVVRPNQAYQLWKQSHAHEIEQDEAKDSIESLKLKQKPKSIIHTRPASSSIEVSSESSCPLLVLLDNDSEKSIDPVMNKAKNFLRPKTSPVNKPLIVQHRINPLLTLLDGCLLNSATQQQQQYPLESSSFYSSSSCIITTGSRKIIQDKSINKHKASNLDALYRMALQNQTAYKSVEKNVIEERKLQDKQFAVQYRALKGSMRLARLPN